MEVVAKFPIKAPLTDIAARLRIMADQIDSGEIDPVSDALIILRYTDYGGYAYYHFGGQIERATLAGIYHTASIKAATETLD